MPPRPNILVVSAVCLRADHLSCYGYGADTTPNLSRLAAEGTIFERAYTTAGWTPPAHASLMTGLYPSLHGVGGDAGLGPAIPTLPGLLGDLGYRTVGIVQQSFVGSYTGMDRGFQEFHELRPGGKAYGAVSGLKRSLSRKIEKIDWVLKPSRLMKRLYVRATRARSTTSRAIRWLDAHRGNPEPYFMLAEYFNVHDFLRPYMALQRYRNRYAAVAEGFEQQVLGARDIATLHALYDAEVRRFDGELGRLLRYIRRQCTLDDTLVVLLSPHGESLGEHGLVGHQGSLYEPIVRVPLIMRHPDFAPPGLRVRSLVQLTDLLPTLLDLAGGDGDDRTHQGRTLLPISDQRTYRDCAISEWEGRIPPSLDESPPTPAKARAVERCGRRLRMIVDGSRKYIRGSDGSAELFDLSADPGETQNLIDREPGCAAAMAARLDAWAGSFPHGRGAPLPEDVDQTILNDLRASGYRL